MRDRTSINVNAIDTDDFYSLPLNTQALYFHLLMRANDVGCVPNARSITKMLGLNLCVLELLETVGYIRCSDNDLYYITDWDVHAESEDV